MRHCTPLNSMSYSHGRPPYMAVFGQIPRVGSGLLQDDKALITKNEQYGSVRSDILRAEAMKAMIEVNTSQAPRRALLLKTATPHHNELLPGQSCAYWRWQNPRGRSTKKRGAWVVARFLAYDPDGRSAWLHSGTTTLQASLEQIRGAHGFEQWQPSGEDIKCLHDASTNIRTDMWQDHRAAAPLYRTRMTTTTSYTRPTAMNQPKLGTIRHYSLLHHHRLQASQHQQSQHKLMWTQPSTHKQHHTTLLSTTSTSTHPLTSIQECPTGHDSQVAHRHPEAGHWTLTATQTGSGSQNRHDPEPHPTGHHHGHYRFHKPQVLHPDQQPQAAHQRLTALSKCRNHRYQGGHHYHLFQRHPKHLR